ncbi:uncharacterized protein LOC129577760 [Sitodiplosis mosellana]|uniref:uncharacterized protein LOC129577760 n=1 Tax=Sitodiplosis mosellana TaxID=263140 RepID=UPI002443DAB1|nr:uncharacterized protein LOC129577760 [Sitodiplosis mosellana]
MDETKVHQCLFCSQTFDSAVEKDDHILEHFVHVTCSECNQDLIQIGSKLYAEHNTMTCIKISEPYVIYEPVEIKQETSYPDDIEQLDEATISAALNIDIEEQQIKTELSIENDELGIQMESNDLEADGNRKAEKRNRTTSPPSSDPISKHKKTHTSVKSMAVVVKGTHTSRSSSSALSASASASETASTSGSTGKGVFPKTECSICGKTITKKILNRHMRELHGDKKDDLKCGLCDFTTKRNTSLLDHQRRVHLQPVKKGRPKKGVARRERSPFRTEEFNIRHKTAVQALTINAEKLDEIKKSNDELVMQMKGFYEKRQSTINNVKMKERMSIMESKQTEQRLPKQDDIPGSSKKRSTK